MGRNYKNYYKEENKEDVVDVPVIPEENKDEVKTDSIPVIPEENKNEVLTNKESNITSDTSVIPEENKDEAISEDVVSKGIVSNCFRLNVREKGSMESNVLKVIDSGTEVDILEIPSKGQFYKVKIDDVIGFCVKDFIELK